MTLKAAALIVLACLMLCSCVAETLNVSGGNPAGFVVGRLTSLDPIVSREQARFQLDWVDGTAPFTIRWSFSDGVTPLEYTTTADDTSAVGFRFSDRLAVTFDELPADWEGMLTVRVTDSHGLFGENSIMLGN